MTIRLYSGPGAGGLHLAGKRTAETFCGIEVSKLQLVGTIAAPSAFTPRPGAIHDDCLTVFLDRHDHDLSSSGENLGWVDMGD